MKNLELGKIYKVNLGNKMIVAAKYVEDGKDNTIVVKPVAVFRDNNIMMLANYYVKYGILQIVSRKQIIG